ncbi:MAG: transporter substrate-binding domain-containing protein [Gammaproteobacteria bacterium]
MSLEQQHCRQTLRRRRRLPVRHHSLLGLVAVLLWATCVSGAPAESGRGDVLRVLKLRHHHVNHPHRDVAGEYRLLADFARDAGVQIEWHDGVEPAELAARLRRGEADLLLADVAPDVAAGAGLEPGLPIGSYRHLVYGRDDLTVRDPRDLAGLRVAVNLSSPLWPYLNALAAAHPMSVVVLPDNTSREALLAGIGTDAWDAAVVSARPGEDPASAMPRVRVQFELAGGNLARWRFAPGRTALRKRVDAYLLRAHAAVTAPQVAMGDLDVITNRHVLRVVTRMDPHNYFVRDGRPAGFEYELMRLYARRNGLSVEFLVGESDQQILDWLRRGMADVVATRIDAGAVRGDPALTQSRSFFHSASVILHRSGPRLLGADDLAGRRVAVLGNSVQHRTLGELVAGGLAAEAVVYPPDTVLSELAGALARGVVDAAIVDAHAVAALRDAHPGITAGASLPSSYYYAWTVRTRDVRLRASLDRFLAGTWRKSPFNVLAARYFDRPGAARFTRFERISPFDHLIRRYAEANDFDWRLIAAQMYHESKFDPHAESTTGARGLMQLQPRTAAAMGVANPFDPEAGIRGGIGYLKRMRQRFAGNIAPRDRTWFALAAYNIGYQRVERARRRAAEQGLDPTRWFGHVEQVMRQLARQDRNVRWGQTVAYVRAIRSLYSTYNRLQETLTAGVEPAAGELRHAGAGAS